MHWNTTVALPAAEPHSTGPAPSIFCTLNCCPRHQQVVSGLKCRRLLRKRGTCEQWSKEGKGAIKWTRLSCRTFAANGVRLQLHALAYNLGNFMRTLAMPKTADAWSLTT